MSDQPDLAGKVRAYWDADAATYDDAPDHGELGRYPKGAVTVTVRGELPALDDHVIIVGYGVNGRNLARVLGRVGIPFIWCSANLMVSLATQARLYREMSGDARFLDMEMAALDWLFGANPWGMSMVIGIRRTMPADV